MAKRKTVKGIKVKRTFVKQGISPYKSVDWEKRTAEIRNDEGEVIFKQKDVKVPKTWSENALTIVASKYFKESPKSPQRERGVDQLIDRVVDTIAKFGIKDKIFASKEDTESFTDDLKYVLVNQMGSFNSPVWFNCFTAGSLVCTKRGMIPIEEIIEGDKVLTHKGNWKSVLRTMQRSCDEPLYRISCRSNINEAECSGEHPYEVYNKETGKREFKEAKNITTEDYIVAPFSKTEKDPQKINLLDTLPNSERYVVENNKITKIIVETKSTKTNAHGAKRLQPFKVILPNEIEVTNDLLYLIGYWIGDGVAFKRESDLWKGLVFSHEEESPYLPRISKIVKEAFGLEGELQKIENLGIRRDCDSFYTLFKSTVLARWFLANFTKGTEKDIPEWIQELSLTKQLAFIYGLLDSDGTISGEQVVLSLSNSSLMWKIRDICLRNMLPISFKKESKPRITPTGKVSSKIVYRLSIGTKPFLGILKEGSLKLQLGNLLIQNRIETTQWRNYYCVDKEQSIIAYRVIENKKIEMKEPYLLYNLSVEEDESYVVEGKSVHNCGVQERPQASACFIQNVEDKMESILQLTVKEGLLFKYGSGTGTNFSCLRSSKESITGGGVASGPVSFMKGYDAFAGIIKSGGKSRRAAKMAILNIDHPDIVEFIECKAKEEKKAWALIDAGYDGGINGEAYSTVAFQNQNNSVRVDDKFMQALIKDEDYWTKFVKSGEPCEKFKASALLKKIAEAAHFCGDPGIQFHDSVNEWHTCPNSGIIIASNPCGEFIFLVDSACNLASINLLRFLKEDGTFDIESFMHTVHLFIIAQEILVGNASYPTKEIEENSHKFRPLGLGFANLGALLMVEGLPYDSTEGRAYAAAITALMTSKAYMTSVELAKVYGPFQEFAKNKAAMLDVIKKHKDIANQCLDRLKSSRENERSSTYEVLSAAVATFEAAHTEGQKYGYRNAQVSLLAPTGTIGFMMDCDSTGIEPCVALVAVKNLVDGSELAIVNGLVGRTLTKLEYNEKQIGEILKHVEEKGGIEGAPHIQDKHLPVFSCAFGLEEKQTISYMGHIRMMGAVQPFLSGAISKTVNMPKTASVEDIYDVFVEAWKLGLKSITVFRDGSKRASVISVKKDKEQKVESIGRAFRKHLPDKRPSITHKFSIDSHEGYVTVGLYPDTGKPGEVFIKMAKEGSTISGLMDTIATQTSIMLQYGITLEALVEKFSYMKFEPSGWSKNKDIGYAQSITDYVFRWLSVEFLKKKEITQPESLTGKTENKEEVKQERKLPQYGPPCSCGVMMFRTGCSFTCPRCGKSIGACS